MTTSSSEFVVISIISMVVVFIFRVFSKEITFIYLNILSSIILLSFTIHYSWQFYSVEQIQKIEMNVITVKTSSLSEKEKSEFLIDSKKSIYALKRIDTSHVFGYSKWLVFGLLFILISDKIKNKRLY